MLEVTLFLDDDDRHEGQPAHEHIMRYLMHHGIAGASAFSAVSGFGHKHHLHHRHGLAIADQGPMMIVFIDEDEKVRQVIPHIRSVVQEGLMVARHVSRL
jgi:PII-like signaling protein